MTIAELIAQLQKFPPDLPVVIRGYESGVDEVNVLLSTRMRRGKCGGPGINYSGDHDLIEDDEADQTGGEPCLHLWHRCVE